MSVRHYLYLLLLITGGIIIGVDGMDTMWNLSPLIVALVVSETIIYAGGKKWNALTPTLRYTSAGLVSGTVLFPLCFHIAWEFKIVESRISSLPYAMFWFLPVLAFVSGAFGGVTGFLIGNHKQKTMVRTTNTGQEGRTR